MAKTVNYTPETTAAIVEAYTAADSEDARKAVVMEMSERFNKTPASVRSKLVKEKVYIAATRPGKKGGVKKADVVDAIALMVPMATNDAESLTKATMRALAAIAIALNAGRETAPETDEG